MKALLIGGTGTISAAVTRRLVAQNWEVFVLNRGTRNDILPKGVQTICTDMRDEKETAQKLRGLQFDAVCEFIGFVPSQVERDYRLFADKTRQYLYISSASAYQKPVTDYRITEETPLSNPYWEYSRNKIACESLLQRLWRERQFPMTIVRPSHTYDERSVPLGVHGNCGSWQVVKRILNGKPVILHGDGTSLWTMTHNSDFAKGFVGLMGNPDAIGEAVHITSDESLCWNQIYQTIADCLHVPLHPYYIPSDFLAKTSSYDFLGSLIGDKSNSVVFDNQKLKRLVPGFEATVKFKDGIRKTIEYVLSHPDCQISDPTFDLWCDRVIRVMEAAKKEIYHG